MSEVKSVSAEKIPGKLPKSPEKPPAMPKQQSMGILTMRKKKLGSGIKRSLKIVLVGDGMVSQEIFSQIENFSKKKLKNSKKIFKNVFEFFGFFSEFSWFFSNFFRLEKQVYWLPRQQKFSQQQNMFQQYSIITCQMKLSKDKKSTW